MRSAEQILTEYRNSFPQDEMETFIRQIQQEAALEAARAMRLAASSKVSGSTVADVMTISAEQVVSEVMKGGE